MTKSETRGNGTQASVHLVLQGKGGVGKSFVSAILAQYFRTKSARVHCMDIRKDRLVLIDREDLDKWMIRHKD